MIWSDRKKGTLVFDNGEEINFEIRVPSCLDIEEIALEKETIKDSDLVKRFLISVDGFDNVDTLLSTGGTRILVRTIAQAIISASSISVELKNA